MPKHIHDFLVEEVNNSVSTVFAFLCRNELEGKQAMEYSSKNMVLNVRQILNSDIKTIHYSQLQNQRYDMEKLQQVLAIEMSHIIDNILISLADSYPRAPASGSLSRMEKVINGVNMVDDKSDLIYANNLRIKDSLGAKKDKEFNLSSLNMRTVHYESICIAIQVILQKRGSYGWIWLKQDQRGQKLSGKIKRLTAG